jgi:hypothetical protein
MLLIVAAFSEQSPFDINSIPKTFLQPHLDLSHTDTFKVIYPFSKDLTHQFPLEGMFKLCSIQKNCSRGR